MRVFIVYAHHEPKSFGAALLQRSVDTLTAAGHEVVVSDLHAMNFNPVASADDFTTPEQRSRCLDDYQARLERIDELEPMVFHPLSDYGTDWRLKPDIEPRSAGQRR